MGNAFIGTSGFTYDHWGDGVFYPKELPQSRWLEFYAQHFDSVEINASFYHLPKPAVFANWRTRTPPDFTFAVKGSRFITHIKRLGNCQEPWARFKTSVRELQDKLKVVLWQLPPGLKANPERLEAFCRLVSAGKKEKPRHAFEFRNESWFTPEIYAVLEKYNCALTIAHSPRWPFAEVETADFIYFRFHGAESLYASNYSDRELKEWASKCNQWMKQGKDVYAYFNNDAQGFAVRNAKTLKNKLAKRKKRNKS